MTLSRFLASGFLSGFSPVSPGTVGTAVYLALWTCCSYYFPSWATLASQLTIFFLLAIIGVLTSRACLRDYRLSASYQEGEKEDPQYIVIDEWAGMQMALLGASLQQPLAIISAFALFRIFDILKPGPVGQAEKLPGEWGIMLDDIVAGLLSLGTWVIVSALFNVS